MKIKKISVIFAAFMIVLMIGILLHSQTYQYESTDPLKTTMALSLRSDTVFVGSMINNAPVVTLQWVLLDSSYRKFVRKLHKKNVNLTHANFLPFRPDSTASIPYLILRGKEIGTNSSITLVIECIYYASLRGQVGAIVFLHSQAKETHSCSGSPCDLCAIKTTIFGRISGCRCDGNPQQNGFCNHTVTTTPFSFND